MWLLYDKLRSYRLTVILSQMEKFHPTSKMDTRSYILGCHYAFGVSLFLALTPSSLLANEGAMNS